MPEPHPDPYDLRRPMYMDAQKFIPRDQTGVDYLLVSPDNDTSKRFSVDMRTREVKQVQLPFKNLNTVDITSANYSDFKFVAVNVWGFIALRSQKNTEYYQSARGDREKIRYDFTDLQSHLTDYTHFFSSATKSAKPRGGMMINAVRTKFDRVESLSVEDIREARNPQNQDKNQQNQQQQQQNQGRGWR